MESAPTDPSGLEGGESEQPTYGLRPIGLPCPFPIPDTSRFTPPTAEDAPDSDHGEEASIPPSISSGDEEEAAALVVDGFFPCMSLSEDKQSLSLTANWELPITTRSFISLSLRLRDEGPQNLNEMKLDRWLSPGNGACGSPV